MRKVFIRTFGCQMNVRDSELVYGLLMEEGYKKADSEEDADVILFNTCSVRQHAEDKVWSEVGRLKKWKDKTKGPSLPLRTNHARKKIIGVIGCMAQSHKEKIFEKFPYVDFISGPANIYDIPDLIRKSRNGREHLSALDKNQRPNTEQPACRDNSISAYVSISEGCNNFCSYCIVPYVRGREQSRPKKLILDEIKKLADSGYKEVILLGQNVNSYGNGRVSGFVKLLEEINKVDGIKRVRFMTSHPKDATKDLFKAMKDLGKVCEHLHLPLQSGSNKILKKMKRGYTIEKYLKLVKDFRKILPESSITTDIIVGFPGETDKDFRNTYGIMKEVKFDGAFVFKYSPRPPAKSAQYKDDVPREVKEERNQILLNLEKDISRNINEKLIGKNMAALWESIDEKNEGRFLGRTRTNKIVLFTSKSNLPKRLTYIKIESVTPYTLVGRENT